MDTPAAPSFRERFSTYFDREVAQKAAKSLHDGAEIGLTVGNEAFTFTREGGKNRVKDGAPHDPQLVFTMTPAAAESVLSHTSEDIGSIGIHIAKMVAVPEADKKITIQFKTGFLTLFGKGYFGVLASGGSQFASYLASKGLNGMGAFKDMLKKMRA